MLFLERNEEFRARPSSCLTTRSNTLYEPFILSPPTSNVQQVRDLAPDLQPSMTGTISGYVDGRTRNFARVESHVDRCIGFEGRERETRETQSKQTDRGVEQEGQQPCDVVVRRASPRALQCEGAREGSDFAQHRGRG